MNFSDKVSKLLCVIVIGIVIFFGLLMLGGYILYRTNVPESSDMILVMASLIISNFTMGCIAYRLFQNLSGPITVSVIFLILLTSVAHFLSKSSTLSMMNLWSVMISFITFILGTLVVKNVRGRIKKVK